MGPGSRVFGFLEAHEVTECPHDREIHFRALDEAFPDVGEVGAQHRYLVAGFKHGEPGLADGSPLRSQERGRRGRPSTSRLESGNKRSIAARPANDSVTLCMSNRFREPVKRYWPCWFRFASIFSLMYGSRSGTYCTSSKMAGGG